jgi:hypothetical protein
VSVYTFALFFWSALVVLAVTAPLVGALARTVWEAIEHALHHGELASIPSAPRPSRP